MYLYAALAARFRWQQAWASSAFLVAAVGVYLSTTSGATFAFVALCLAAIGFKAASALFWPIPQAYLDARIAAPAIALINSVGNLGGFVARTAFGIFEARTGSIQGGLVGLAAVALLASLLVFFARTRAPGGGNILCAKS